MSNILEHTFHLHLLTVDQDEDVVYIGSCRSFQGCHSYGKTIDDTMKNIKEVIEICIFE